MLERPNKTADNPAPPHPERRYGDIPPRGGTVSYEPEMLIGLGRRIGVDKDWWYRFGTSGWLTPDVG